jgi:Arc/MetJ-type ribon-helix-helix transcriptional regulator
MIKKTVHLPEDLKASLQQLAREEGTSEAEIIRRALRFFLSQRARPRPRIPLTNRGLGDSTIAENVDHHLHGFGSETASARAADRPRRQQWRPARS